jgi:NAD(P)-dependent dehydrogenase (short-subunit alcohol dehydrogenase family)
MMKLQNATALVTGANRGIGRAFVQALLDAGVQKVYATARDRSSLEALTALDPMRVIPLQVDVTDQNLVSRLTEQASDVNLLINNAGVLSFGNILDTPVEVIHQQFDVNFYGTLHMARAFVPVLERNGGGAIVNLLTLVALASMPGLAAYNRLVAE